MEAEAKVHNTLFGFFPKSHLNVLKWEVGYGNNLRNAYEKTTQLLWEVQSLVAGRPDGGQF